MNDYQKCYDERMNYVRKQLGENCIAEYITINNEGQITLDGYFSSDDLRKIIKIAAEVTEKFKCGELREISEG